jgi:hypothetical protein
VLLNNLPLLLKTWNGIIGELISEAKTKINIAKEQEKPQEAESLFDEMFAWEGESKQDVVQVPETDKRDLLDQYEKVTINCLGFSESNIILYRSKHHYLSY